MPWLHPSHQRYCLETLNKLDLLFFWTQFTVLLNSLLQTTKIRVICCLLWWTCACVYAEAGSPLISAGRLRCSRGTAASSAMSFHCHSAPVQHICCTLLLQTQCEQNKAVPYHILASRPALKIGMLWFGFLGETSCLSNPNSNLSHQQGD